MPPDGFLDGWQRADERRVFAAESLYDHIDGGAELFLELGFDRLEVQHYAAGEAEVAVEAYLMTDDAAATGIYLLKCGREAPVEALEVRHTASPYQVQAVQGRGLIVVNRLAGEVGVATMAAFAGWVAGQLEPAPQSTLFTLLPTADRVPASERVIRGPLTMEPVYVFSFDDVFGLQAKGITAVAADYESAEGRTWTRIVVPYADPAEAAAAFAGLMDGLDPALEILDSDGDRVVFEDASDEYGEVRLEGARIVADVRLAERPE
jgi:hypothetical protein